MNGIWLLRSLTIVACALFLMATTGTIAEGQEDAEAMKEEKRLSGLWRVDVFEVDGRRDTAKGFKDEHKSSEIFASRWLFTTTKAEWILSDFKFEFVQYKLNLRATPKTIDLQMKDATIKGIYMIDDKVLKVCFAVGTREEKQLVPGKEERPTDFTTKENSERLLIIFLRDEKGKK